MSTIFAQRLRAVREFRGLTQVELAQSLGMQQSQLCQYEKGDFKPSFDTLMIICNTLEVSADYLMGLRYKANFRNEEALPDEMKFHIQGIINMIANQQPQPKLDMLNG